MSSLKKYRRVKYLGKGSYGAAILVELRSDPSKKFVIKEIVIGHLKPAEQASAKGEADVLHQMNHSNITMYVESFVENSKLYIVMEHADGGDLSGTIQKRKSEGNFYAEDEVMRIFVQICLALKHVHAANILHRDLKSQNIFLTLKGMVKLGDFGIAKVLDASDGQAATQIGTPYYLSPEICESKPYGRKSDVWSLGVVLYEIIALEMPFQAQSLPALVVKICSGEPNYTLVATKYSPALIALTRSMLQKNPDKRPSLSQIVKTDFIMNHISKLLSYTIKMGNGGVVNVNPLLLPSDVQFKDADEADRNIELEKVRQRDQEGKDKDSVKRLEEREKLRRFKQDRVAESRQGANGIADVEESKDGRARGRSPARERGVSPVRGGRAASPVRQRSPVRGGGVESPKRGNSPTRSNRDAAPQRQYDRNVGPAPKVAPNPAYPVQQPVAIGRGRSLAEIQQDRQRDSAMEAMRRGGAVDSSYNGGGRHSHGGADDRGAMVVAKGRENQYENAARSEYFANRAAAQAAKARVEQDLHGGEGLSIISGKPANDTSRVQQRSGSNAHQQPPLVIQQTSQHVRRNSDGDRGNYNESNMTPGGGNRYSIYEEQGLSEAETRIAAIKAQKERDRESALALKEMQLKQAIEDNREDRRRREEDRQSAGPRKSAIAFDIDLSGDGVTSKIISPPPLRNSQAGVVNQRRRESGDSKVNESNSPATVRAKPQLSSQVLPSIKKPAALSVNQPSISEDISDAADFTPSDNTPVRQKKGWGQPVNPAEVQIATGVARFSANDKSTAHDMFSRETPTPTKSGKVNAAVDSGESVDYSSVNSSRMSLDGNDSDAPANDSEVRRFLANKRASQVEARQQAKVVFKKLREQKQKEAETKVHKRVVRMSVVGGDSKYGESKSPGAPQQPMKARLMDVMSSVDAANESVQKAMAAGSKGYRQSVDYSAGDKGSDSARCSAGAKDAKGGSTDCEVEEVDDEEEDRVEEELQDTLGNWLQKQRRGVTTRSRRGGSKNSAQDDDLRDLVAAEDDIIADECFVTTSGTVSSATIDRRDEEVEEEDDFPTPERVLLSDDMGNDVEVVGLQCMLAEALMREDVDTDEEDN